jgi:hypothetical protein
MLAPNNRYQVSARYPDRPHPLRPKGCIAAFELQRGHHFGLKICTRRDLQQL